MKKGLYKNVLMKYYRVVYEIMQIILSYNIFSLV